MTKVLTGVEAVDEADFEKLERGAPIKKVLKPVTNDPESPKVDDIIQYSPELENNLVQVMKISVSNKRNDDGVRFIGYEVVLNMKGEKILTGWMPESDYVTLRRSLTRKGMVNTNLFI